MRMFATNILRYTATCHDAYHSHPPTGTFTWYATLPAKLVRIDRRVYAKWMRTDRIHRRVYANLNSPVTEGAMARRQTFGECFLSN